ncbi:hypothetical protein DUI87_10390 [Hirundo rustica rustica]|uniref:Rna-directed dna polymerase from mobile element jockey-like n=1 Tax=Hirundo rustica rustica TaxID=333673 RepID=A0A3M0KIE2_HIRRU|nr:hypothetical protein DUI87_10390 [Hirundo rustica rustica]
MDSGIECTLSKFGNNKLHDIVNMLERKDEIQRDLDRLVRRTSVNLMKLNKGKCKVLHLGHGNPCYKYRLGDELMESSPAEKDVRVLVDKILDMSWQCALAAQEVT